MLSTESHVKGLSHRKWMLNTVSLLLVHYGIHISKMKLQNSSRIIVIGKVTYAESNIRKCGIVEARRGGAFRLVE